MNQISAKRLRCIFTSTFIIFFFGLLCSSCVTGMKSSKTSRTASQQSQVKPYTFTVKVDSLDSQSQNKIRVEMQKLGKVESVQVNQKSGLVNVTFKIDHKISNSQVMQAVRKAGYTPKEIIKNPLELSQLENMIPQKK